MKNTTAWRALAVGALLGGAVVVCPSPARADQPDTTAQITSSDSGQTQEKKDGDIIVQKPIIIKDPKK
ncbi:hypothetical protein [Capsulimonas corticalis]|nr:hypothetical protein [Capsulimonas corticalis]